MVSCRHSVLVGVPRVTVLVLQTIVARARAYNITMESVTIVLTWTVADVAHMLADPYSAEGEVLRKSCRKAFEFINMRNIHVPALAVWSLAWFVLPLTSDAATFRFVPADCQHGIQRGESNFVHKAC